MTQKELKAAYTEELKKAWNDDKMVKYCSKSTAFVIEHNGALYGIEKPKIETSFCFGYGINGIADTEQERTAEVMAETARMTTTSRIHTVMPTGKRRTISRNALALGLPVMKP